MAVNGIDIDLHEVGEIATDMKKSNKTMQEELKVIESEIKQIKKIWVSESQNVLADAFSELGAKCERFHSDLDSYADFLLNVAKEYGYTEENNNKNAESFL